MQGMHLRRRQDQGMKSSVLERHLVPNVQIHTVLKVLMTLPGEMVSCLAHQAEMSLQLRVGRRTQLGSIPCRVPCRNRLHDPHHRLIHYDNSETRRALRMGLE
jgi:hypothetical protein